MQIIIFSFHRMKKLRSMSELSQYYLEGTARISKTYGKYVASSVSSFTMLMKTCKGRDKFCSLIQYTADFYYNCNKYSQIETVQDAFRNGTNTGANLCFKLRSSMKNSRKIFKFLKFIDQISSILKQISAKKPIYMKVVAILEHIMAAVSSFFDNIIWGINIEVLHYWFSSHYKVFKANKYLFSLCKVIFKMLGNNFKQHMRIKNMKENVVKMRNYKEQLMTEASPSYQEAKEYLKNRREVRIENLDGAISICRIVMLVRKLKLPGYSFVTKILYSACGLLSTCLSVFKMVVDQPILVQLQEKNKDKEEMSPLQFEDIRPAKRIKINRSGTLNFI